MEELSGALSKAIAAADRDIRPGAGSAGLFLDHVRFRARLVPAQAEGGAGRFRFWSSDDPASDAVEALFDWTPDGIDLVPLPDAAPAVRDLPAGG